MLGREIICVKSAMLMTDIHILLSVNLGDDGHFSPWCIE